MPHFSAGRSRIASSFHLGPLEQRLCGHPGPLIIAAEAQAVCHQRGVRTLILPQAEANDSTFAGTWLLEGWKPGFTLGAVAPLS